MMEGAPNLERDKEEIRKKLVEEIDALHAKEIPTHNAIINAQQAFEKLGKEIKAKELELARLDGREPEASTPI